MFRQKGHSINSTMAIATRFFGSLKALTQTQNVIAPIAGRHIPALDGIRGTAILLVFAHHLIRSLEYEFSYTNPLFRAANFGWVGVDLFFVLSGFLITGILYDSKTSPHYFKNFYVRRVLRIFPLYFGALTCIALLRNVWPEGGVYGKENPAWMWIYLTNIVIAVKGAGAFGLVDHFWSLAIEEHFYLAWPLAVFLLNRRQLIQLAVALFFISFGLRVALVLGGASADTVYVFTPLRLDALSTGAFLALVARSPEGLQRFSRATWLVGSVSTLAILVIILSRHTLYHADPVMQTFGYSLLAVFFGVLLTLGVTSPLQRVFDLQILRWFGKYSYGLYVWHPILFILLLHTDLARKIRGGNGTVEMIVSVGIALSVIFAVTLFSWHCWESQFLKLKRHFE